VLAQINANRGDLLDAESGFFFAISLEPNEPTPHHWYSVLLQKVGRIDAALAQARKAQELDPTSPILAANLANAYLVNGDDDAALRYAGLASELGLAGGTSQGVQITVALRRGQWDEARRLLAEHEALPPEMKDKAQVIVAALADPAKRATTVAEMKALDPKVVPQDQLIGSYLALGETDLAYRLMFESLDRHDRAWVRDNWGGADPWGAEGAALRRDPRFGELAQRMGLLDYWKQYGFPDGCRAGQGTAVVCN